MGSKLFDPGSDDVLYLVDISGYVFRAYHAIQPLTSPSGEPTHAVFGTVNMLERLVRQGEPRLLAVCMDSRTRTFRKDLYPQYKANRPPPPADLKQQMVRVFELISAFGIPVLQQDGYEADDVIASAIRHAKERGLRVVIVSADKDLMQLIGPDVLMWDTMRERVFGIEEVEERFGVRVDQVRDVLALTGDSSDNVPGVPSVGPKTAQQLISEYGTLGGIYENLAAITKKKLKEKLEENKDQEFLSPKLVTLHDECDVELSPEKIR
jgi:DNA polymerase-1